MGATTTLLWFGTASGAFWGEKFFFALFHVVVAYVLGFGHSRDGPCKQRT